MTTKRSSEWRVIPWLSAIALTEIAGTGWVFLVRLFRNEIGMPEFPPNGGAIKRITQNVRRIPRTHAQAELTEKQKI